jgi:hypothetical protein
VQVETGISARDAGRALQRLTDTAALRRYLVDEDLLARERGEYWRAGGTFDPAVDLGDSRS